MIDVDSKITFAGRCPSIKKGQWIVHKINEQMPSISSTRHAVTFNHIEDVYSEAINDYLIRRSLFDRKICTTKFSLQEKQAIDIYKYRRELVKKINDARQGIYPLSLYERAVNLIWQLKYEHIGNCGEVSTAAEIIAKMNGIKNACIGIFKCENQRFDHQVCLFNIDDSKVTKIVNNKTVIIDPWSGVVDFANNAFEYYKNVYGKLFNLKENDCIKLHKTYTFPFSAEELEKLSKEFPQLKKTP